MELLQVIRLFLISTLVLGISGTSEVPHCDDVVASGLETGTQGMECYLDMVDSNNATMSDTAGKRNEDLPERDIDSAAGPVQCANQIPTYASVRGLCSNTVPRIVTLPPAYSRTRARCEVYIYGNAAFAICNADYCSGNRFGGQKNVCNRIYNTCSRRSKGGYVEYTQPDGISSLYRQGTRDNPPIYSNC